MSTKPADKSLNYMKGLRDSPSKNLALPPGGGPSAKVPFRLPSEILASRRGKRIKMINTSNKKTTARNQAKVNAEEILIQNNSVNHSEGIGKRMGAMLVPDSSASISPVKMSERRPFFSRRAKKSSVSGTQKDTTEKKGDTSWAEGFPVAASRAQKIFHFQEGRDARFAKEVKTANGVGLLHSRSSFSMSPKKETTKAEHGFAILPLQAERVQEGRDTHASVGGIKAVYKVRAEEVKRSSQNSFFKGERPQQ